MAAIGVLPSTAALVRRAGLPLLALALATGCTSTSDGDQETLAEQEAFEDWWHAQERAESHLESLWEEVRLCSTFPEEYGRCPDMRRVVEVVDGDTLRLKPEGPRDERDPLVRIAGIDAAELHPEAECGAEEARSALHDLLLGPDNEQENPLLLPSVLLRPVPGHPERDVHGRLLAAISAVGWTPTDADPLRVEAIEDVATWLVSRGLARVSTYALDHYATTPRTAHQVRRTIDRYAEAEDRSVGMWIECGWR